VYPDNIFAAGWHISESSVFGKNQQPVKSLISGYIMGIYEREGSNKLKYYTWKIFPNRKYDT
jgi:hypothetical protein